jgi:hypothetical protein
MARDFKKNYATFIKITLCAMCNNNNMVSVLNLVISAFNGEN